MVTAKLISNALLLLLLTPAAHLLGLECFQSMPDGHLLLSANNNSTCNGAFCYNHTYADKVTYGCAAHLPLGFGNRPGCKQAALQQMCYCNSSYRCSDAPALTRMLRAADQNAAGAMTMAPANASEQLKTDAAATTPKSATRANSRAVLSLAVAMLLPLKC